MDTMDNTGAVIHFKLIKLVLSPAFRYGIYQSGDDSGFEVRVRTIWPRESHSHFSQDLRPPGLSRHREPAEAQNDNYFCHTSMIFFIFPLSLASTTTTSCNLGICDKIDRSSLPFHQYRLRRLPLKQRIVMPGLIWRLPHLEPFSSALMSFSLRTEAQATMPFTASHP